MKFVTLTHFYIKFNIISPHISYELDWIFHIKANDSITDRIIHPTIYCCCRKSTNRKFIYSSIFSCCSLYRIPKSVNITSQIPIIRSKSHTPSSNNVCLIYNQQSNLSVTNNSFNRIRKKCLGT